MLGSLLRDIPDCVPPDSDTKPPRLKMPANACDCHAHVCGPVDKYPLKPERLYSPTRSSFAEYWSMLDTIGVERAVLVQPSFYGSDSSALLDALHSNPEMVRGVAVIDAPTSKVELKRLHAAGIRGIRFNIVDQRDGKGVFPGETIKALSRDLADLGWHVELLMHVDEFPQLEELIADIPVDVVFAHFGYPAGAGRRESAGFRAFLTLLERRKAWVKLSGPYRVSSAELPYPDIDRIVRDVVATAADRLLWGSDWPHVRASWATTMSNDGDLVDLLERWIPDSETRHQVLVRNPQELYWNT